jgi:hypothetical protein
MLKDPDRFPELQRMASKEPSDAPEPTALRAPDVMAAANGAVGVLVATFIAMHLSYFDGWGALAGITYVPAVLVPVGIIQGIVAMVTNRDRGGARWHFIGPLATLVGLFLAIAASLLSKKGGC